MDTFCVLPWFGREINFNNLSTHCCLLPLKYDIENIKSKMLAGERPAECQKCWNLEDQGIKSDRQVKNSALDFYWNRDLDKIITQAKAGANEILLLKLITSYTCNATCVSCGPGSSSSWQELSKKINIPILYDSYKKIDIAKIQQQVDFSKLIALSFIGGEPLYEKINFELLEHLIAIGNKQIFISMVTNGSVALSDKQKRILSKFKNLNFSVSIDGIGPVFEYLRYPLKWTVLQDNLTLFRQLTDNVSSNYTISNLNILYHPQTVEWFNQQNIVFSPNPIYNPDWLQPRALPTGIKQILKEKLDQVDYDAFIGNLHTDQDTLNFESMLENIRLQDRAKGIRINDYLPELVKMF